MHYPPSNLSTDALYPAYEAEFRRSPPRTCAGGASHPSMARVSDEKLRRFHPELFGFSGWWIRFIGTSLSRQHIIEWTYHGDSRAAIVMSASPLIVAAYTDELDCVAMLRFPDELANEYQLQVGSRLLTANSYLPRSVIHPLQKDLWDGPDSYQNHGNFNPLIVDFLSDDMPRIQQRKAEIDESEWGKTWHMGQWRMSQVGTLARDGRPRYSGRAAR